MDTFPTIAWGDHPGGCLPECDFPLHLTPSALETLRRAGVSASVIRAALDHEASSHGLIAEYPLPAGGHGWNPRIEATLSGLGIDPDVIRAARTQVDRATQKRALRAEKAVLSKADSVLAEKARVRAWKEANRDRTREHARAFRARRRLEVIR